MKTEHCEEISRMYKFRCPKCRFVYWYSHAQLSHPRFFDICNICETKIVIERPPEIQVPIKKEKISTPLRKEALQLLILYGYSRGEAKLRLNNVFDQSKSLEQLVIDSIKQG